MPRNYYTQEEANHLGDIITLRRMVGEAQVEGAPCPLALAQLDELLVLTQKLRSTALKLHTSIREAGYARPGE